MSNINNKGLVLVISSPSGAGKTTICKKLIDEVDGIDLSVSVTTRKKRKEEIHGKHYFFKNESGGHGTSWGDGGLQVISGGHSEAPVTLA